MREVLRRRLRELAEGRASGQPGARTPDLIVVDGGKGQLSAALEALETLNLRNKLPVAALAKQEEEIFNTLSYERSVVLDYVETCLFESTSKALKVEFSPYIAKILYNYVKSKLVPQN